MTPIEDILANSASLTIAALEAHHAERDAAIVNLTKEKLAIHDVLEKRRLIEERAARGPANLKQTLNPGAPPAGNLEVK